MTFGVCQGPRCLPAGVPGISMALGQEDRLRPKGRLRQQPAGDSTDESQSRAKKTRFLQRLFRRKWPTLDKIDRGEGRAWRKPRPDSTNQRAGAFPTKGSEAKGRAYAPQMPVQGGKGVYKVPPSEKESEGQKITPKTQPRRSRQPGNRPPNL
jgi:hypothetical protein